jgi:hypothetical protein
MAQQSARRGRKNQTESVCFEHVNLMWFRSANSHTGQQLTLHYRPDRWQHPTTCQNFQIPLATEGASTDDSGSVRRPQLSDLYWLTDEQMARLQPTFPRAMGSRGSTTGGC